ncbi:hypothetical protein TNCT_50141 [Trichonephila clavata]|uniref:Uncharacterized protein n=1 Tax=Trichonephila clavata TaxID=2740835 RepID=A0A8X6J642_TRICU|nr:hypothetical protein TNCT_50141 [Trichonephila clavata]
MQKYQKRLKQTDFYDLKTGNAGRRPTGQSCERATMFNDDRFLKLTHLFNTPKYECIFFSNTSAQLLVRQLQHNLFKTVSTTNIMCMTLHPGRRGSSACELEEK